LTAALAAYADRVFALPPMQQWAAAASAESEVIFTDEVLPRRRQRDALLGETGNVAASSILHWRRIATGRRRRLAG
jgi:hypothetical protein